MTHLRHLRVLRGVREAHRAGVQEAAAAAQHRDVEGAQQPRRVLLRVGDHALDELPDLGPGHLRLERRWRWMDVCLHYIIKNILYRHIYIYIHVVYSIHIYIHT